MPLAFTKTDEWDDGKRVHALGTLAASGSYATGGEVPTTGTQTGLVARGSKSAPKWVTINGKGTHSYRYDRSTQKVLAFAGATEHVAGAYVAAVTGDVIDVHAVYDKFR